MEQSLTGLLRAALEEDLGPGDVTTEACIPPDSEGQADLVVQGEGIVSGLVVVRPLLSLGGTRTGEECEATLECCDGERVHPGSRVLRMEGSLRTMLVVERTLLNFLQHLSGIATQTNRYVEAVRGTGARILDTRKTTPGLRSLEKAAVVHGGGCNHRFGLFDGVLIKDNHIAAAGGIGPAVCAARKRVHHLLRIEVECDTLEQVEEAVSAGADVVMLDNMPVDVMREAVVRFGSRVTIEASGGITLDRVREVADAGVRYISVGALTHSVPILPMHLEIAT